MLTLQETYRLSRDDWIGGTKLPQLDLATVSKSREYLFATGQILVGRTPEIQAAYAEFRSGLGERSVQDVLLEKFGRIASNLGRLALPRAVVLLDEYPANMVLGLQPVNHYNLWLRICDATPDFAAGEVLLDRLVERDAEREAKCFQATQTVPPTPEFPYDHCHVFTLAVLPEPGLVLVDEVGVAAYS